MGRSRRQAYAQARRDSFLLHEQEFGDWDGLDERFATTR
jgi:hypothetical protein